MPAWKEEVFLKLKPILEKDKQIFESYSESMDEMKKSKEKKILKIVVKPHINKEKKMETEKVRKIPKNSRMKEKRVLILAILQTLLAISRNYSELFCIMYPELDGQNKKNDTFLRNVLQELRFATSGVISSRDGKWSIDYSRLKFKPDQKDHLILFFIKQWEKHRGGLWKQKFNNKKEKVERSKKNKPDSSEISTIDGSKTTIPKVEITKGVDGKSFTINISISINL